MASYDIKRAESIYVATRGADGNSPALRDLAGCQEAIQTN